MLEALNRYAHGFVAVPVVVACRKRGMFEALRAHGPMELGRVVAELHANEGHLRAALRLLQSLGWLDLEDDRLRLTPEGENEREIPDDAGDVLRLPMAEYFRGEAPAGLLGPWITRAQRRWGARNPRVADLLDGTLAVRTLAGLETTGALAGGPAHALARVAPSAKEELGRLFEALGWAHREGDGVGLTDTGRYILDRAMIVGTLAAYTPMLNRMPELLFGDAAKVFARDGTGQERHVDRTLNVASSGFQHDRYFADVDEMLVTTFDKAPLGEQPRYVADMGCGDGTFLKRVYETVSSRTARGRALTEHPLTLIGIDFNEAALEATRKTLAGLPHVLLKGDIGDPVALLASFREQGVDPDAVLHIRSFLDHDRPFVPGDPERARQRTRLGHRGVYVDAKGASIAPAAMMQALVEHLGRWAAVVNRHGLAVLEVHNLDPRIANAYFDSTESIHFDAYHAFSMQYLVEAAEFLTAAAEAGLFPRAASSRRYPKTLPFARITLNWLERRPYVIRPAALTDLAALVELERVSTAAALQASEVDLRTRLESEPAGHLVLEKDGRIAAAAYSQRIADVSALEGVRHADLAGLRREGPVVQLLGLVVHPDFQDQGLGDELLEFVLQRAELLPGVERVAGISRCKEWKREVPFTEYVHARMASGEPQDPILRFHGRHGARVRAIVEGYRPADADNDGCGVLIEYDLADRRAGPRASTGRASALGEGRAAQVVEASVREVLGPRRQEAFAPGMPLMDMGLDSMDLTELKSLLARRLGVDLDPTLFFRHRTPAAVAEHLGARSGRTGAPAARVESSATSAPRPRSVGPLPARPLRPAERPRIPPRPEAANDSIAIVGMACRFASANSTDEYWALLRDGVHAVRQAPEKRRGWARKPIPDADPSVASAVRYGGFLDQVDGFDASFFGISPREARSMDPQQRLLLETSWHALEDAGIAPSSLSGSATAVFVGICTHDYEVLQLLTGSPQAFDSHFTSGNLASVAAGRMAYCYGFHGPAMSVDTACSSSLVGLHLAAQSLRAGECDLALACGVNLMLAQEMSLVYARLRVLAPDGRCKTFDASADGYVRGEGSGVVVLKRLEQAKADGDRILAVVRGSAINQDGPSNGLTAPNGDAQEAVIRQALRSAGVSPLEISHIETHGTGTVIGDPIEVQALHRVFGPGRSADQPLVISSAKTVVGHIEPAAGIAGLIKVVLSLQNERIPTHLHLKEPNPLIPLADIPAVVPTEGRPWPREEGRPRVAGVSSFGLSGTNAHVIVEEAPAVERGESRRGRPLQVLPLSARTGPALQGLARSYGEHLRARPGLRLPDACFTAAVGRSHLEHRLGVVFEHRDELLAELARVGEGVDSPSAGGDSRMVSGVSSAQGGPRIAFLFSGQGSQYPGMAGELFDSEPVFREAIEHCDAVLREECDLALVSMLYPRGTPPDLRETSRLQPALFAVEYGLSRLWRSWGIEPYAVIGHSLGEYVAACVAGVIGLEDALRLVAARGRLMGGLEEKGIMVAAATNAARATSALAGREHEVSIACLNGPASVVLAGRPDAVNAAVARLESEGVRTKALAVSNAFHSPLMEPILDAFEEEVRRTTLRVPDRVFVSNLLGRPVTQEVTTSGYWRRHLRETVRFSEGLEALFQEGCDTFVEIGPGTTLLGLGRIHADPESRTWLPSLQADKPEAATLLGSLAGLYVRGAQVDWASFHRGTGSRKVALPAYPFERKAFWFDDGEAEAPREAAMAEVSAADLEHATATGSTGGLEAGLADDVFEIVWIPAAASSRPTPVSGDLGRWLIFLDDQGVGEAVLERLRAAGGSGVGVVPGPGLAQLGPNRWQVDPGSSGDLGSVLERASGGAPLRGILHLWSLRAMGSGDVTPASLAAAQVVGVESILLLVQAMGESNGETRLWLATQEALATGRESRRLQLAHAALPGLARTVRLEYPEMWGGLVDLEADQVDDRAHTLVQEVFRAGEEDEVAYRGGLRLVPRLRRRPRPVKAGAGMRGDASYLVVGGFGGLGLRVALWLAAQGARSVVLSGRRAPDESARRSLQKLEDEGIRVTTVQADVSDPVDVERMFASLRGLPPLAGLINAAGVLDEGLLVHQDRERFRRVMSSKVAGSWNLHQCTQDLELDFFVSFSSMAAIVGLAGQGSYSAANAFQDALTHYRRSIGLSALSVNWGAWAEVGMAAKMPMTDRSFRRIAPAEGTAMLGDLIAEGQAQAVVFPVDWLRFAREMPGGRVPSMLKELLPRGSEARPTVRPDGTVDRLRGAAPQDREAVVVDYVRRAVAWVLGSTSLEDVDPTRGFWTIGLDSLLALQLRNRLQGDLGCSLPGTLTMDHPNVAALAAYLIRKLELGAEGASPRAAVPRTPRVREAAPDLERLSESEAEALLIERLQELEG